MVPQSCGEAILWGTESQSPGILWRRGWRHDSIKAGDNVVMIVHPLRDGSCWSSVKDYVVRWPRVHYGARRPRPAWSACAPAGRRPKDARLTDGPSPSAAGNKPCASRGKGLRLALLHSLRRRWRVPPDPVAASFYAAFTGWRCSSN